MSFPTVDNAYTEGVPYTFGLVYLNPYLYVLYWGGWPEYQPKVHKLNPDTYEKIGEWLAPSGSCMASSICTDCEHIYVGTSNVGETGHHHPIHVYKIDPDTMTTVVSWAGENTGDVWAESIQFDFKSKRLLVLESRGPYRIYKLTQNLTEDMRKDAEGGWPPSQYHGNDLTILGDYCYIATGGTPGIIVKRKISDLEMVGYFEGSFDDPDSYIEGIFFNLCNDGEFLYTATYDYSEERPSRLIKVDPSDMTRVDTYYGDVDEMMAYGSYAYGGKVYMLLMGWNGIFWDEPDYQEGEVIVQIYAAGMTRAARHQNWTGEWTDAVRAVGDGSRLHVGFWGESARSVLQFAESGTELCALAPCTCTVWVNAECTSPGKRRQTRICTPAGCDIEERIIDDPTCVPSEGTLSVTTSPTGASIMVDGVTKTSPCNFSLAHGTYTVTITKVGYDTITDTVTITAGATTTKNYTLTLSKKVITFESVPAGATVKLV